MLEIVIGKRKGTLSFVTGENFFCLPAVETKELADLKPGELLGSIAVRGGSLNIPKRFRDENRACLRA